MKMTPMQTAQFSLLHIESLSSYLIKRFSFTRFEKKTSLPGRCASSTDCCDHCYHCKKKESKVRMLFFPIYIECRKTGNEMLMTRIEVLIYVLTFKFEYTSVLDRKRIVEKKKKKEHLNYYTIKSRGISVAKCK